jgi:hypothetical protein
MANGKIDLLCQYIENSKAKNYPIKNDCLCESTDFIKNGYLKMLAVILQQAGETTDAQVNIYKRILAGAQSELTAEDFLRMALSIEIEDFVNFTEECKELTLKYNFVLDAIILIGVKEKKEEQLRLVVGFCEALGITKEEMRYLATIAKAILEMSESAYVDAYEIKTDRIPDMVFQEYMYLIAKSSILANDNLTIFQPSCAEQVNLQMLEKLRKVNTPNIKLVNVEINLDEYHLCFFDKSGVVFESCVFRGSKYPIIFDNCKKVEIRNTKFIDFSSRTLKLESVNSAWIKGCIFRNCLLVNNESCDDIGGVIFSDKPETNDKINIEKTIFENCGDKGKYYRAFQFISNVACIVSDSNFTNCWHWRDGDRSCRDDVTMFPREAESINCVYENSAEFS